MNLFYLSASVAILAALCFPEWIDLAINAWRSFWCPLDDHDARLRFSGIRLHYECACCKCRWSEDRVRKKPNLNGV